ncbi:MAG: hypothetical protein KME60_11940 [Cyanomargarita calcarea GSE-NOS-MK-12-04C]|jgi:catechol 2,3-dioxygenase-like lactoylglutathione lyase family enzyme|uniref:Uncharacterized protein n=1 Tax=Cyanomargarita calcarea GSE-NOS-MK-12-04C TaxID=2839659 RepID=A0A951QLU1_9CYAN|nr:hypothetical protein [Cyanomargarita calcarea GSE-NOS-MK-12-04C]
MTAKFTHIMLMVEDVIATASFYSQGLGIIINSANTAVRTPEGHLLSLLQPATNYDAA